MFIDSTANRRSISLYFKQSGSLHHLLPWGFDLFGLAIGRGIAEFLLIIIVHIICLLYYLPVARFGMTVLDLVFGDSQVGKSQLFLLILTSFRGIVLLFVLEMPHCF